MGGDIDIIFDTETGLEWYEGPEEVTWDEARQWVETLDVGRIDNWPTYWRMPTKAELTNINTEHPNAKGIYLPEAYKTTGFIWTAETYADEQAFLWIATPDGGYTESWWRDEKMGRAIAVRCHLYRGDDHNSRERR